MKTVVLYNIEGVSKAKTAKAVLLFDPKTNKQAWIPLSIATVKFIGPDYAVKVTVPDWFFNKIAWKDETPVKPTKPTADVGNMMEERMVLIEMYDSLDETSEDDVAEQTALAKRIKLIDEAVALA